MKQSFESKGAQGERIGKPSADKKFLQHFQTINTPLKPQPHFSTSSNSKNYANLMQAYASTISIIDKIAQSPVKESRISQVQAQQLDFVTSPLMLSLNPGIRERISNINEFFSSIPDNSWREQNPTNLLGYIKAVSGIKVNNVNRNIERQSSQSRSRSKSHSRDGRAKTDQKAVVQHPPLATPPRSVGKAMLEAEVNTEPVREETPSSNSRSPQKLKRIDLLLVEIMREKKRKGMVGDYFRAIEMKLVELLEYILQDEDEYFGLELTQKMKLVLKNLEKFKGKTIDGQSKVNMLRIFFEEFRNLKRQREEGYNEENNSVSERHSSIAQSNSRSNQEKEKPKLLETERKQMLGVPSNKGAASRGMGSRGGVSNKGSKNLETMSVGGKNPGVRKAKGTKSSIMDGNDDEWMGSLG